MKGHLEKARHNERFLEFIELNVENDFHEWRITVMFYSALHYMRAYLKLKKVSAGNSHKDLDFSINPKNPKATFPLPQDIHSHYQNLYQNSRNSRYSNYVSSDFQSLLVKYNTEESRKSLEALKTFFAHEGLFKN